MALTERLAVLIDANTGTAVKEFQKLGGAADDLDKKTSKTDKALEKLGLSGTVTGAQLKAGVAAGAAVAGVALVSFAGRAIDAASDLNETIAATDTIFEGAAEQVKEFARGADAIGLSDRAAAQAANTFGDLFQKIGYTANASATLSEDVVRMAADWASFKNMQPDEVLQKIQSGLAGETEGLRALGVFITEASVKSKALELGLGDAHGELTEGEKITARYKLIMEGLGKAQGDVARTSDSYANVQRRSEAASEDLAASVGRQLLPVWTDLKIVTGELIGSLAGVSSSAEDSNDSFLRTFPVVSQGVVALEWLAGQSKETAEEVNYLADSEAILANSQEYTKEQVAQATQTLREQEQALNDLLRATTSQFSAEVQYQQAILGVQSDLAAYDEALALNRDGKAENDVSALELQRQELGLRDALLSAADAAVKQADDNAAAAGRTLSESEKYVVFRDTLVRLKEQFPALSGQIDSYIARLGDVPSNVNTAVTVTDQATPKLAAISRMLDDLSGRSVSTVVNTTHRSRQDVSLLLPGASVERRASGGPVWPGEPFIVGEEGPEVVTFGRSGYVHPNRGPSAPAIGGGGGVVINIYGPTDPAGAALAVRDELIKAKRSGMNLGLA